MLIVLEQGAKKIKFYYPNPFQKQENMKNNAISNRINLLNNNKSDNNPEILSKESISLPSNEKLQKAFILDFAYSEKLNIVFIFFL